MKKNIAAIFILLFSKSYGQVTLVPVLGLQTSHTKIYGYNPRIQEYKVLGSGPSFSAKAFINTRTSKGIYVGYSGTIVPLQVNTAIDPFVLNSARLIQKILNTINRYELGYFIRTKKLYINNLLFTNTYKKYNKGLNLRIHLFTGITRNYNRVNDSISVGDLNIGQLSQPTMRVSTTGMTAGANIQLGIKKTNIVVISISRHWNFSGSLAGGTFKEVFPIGSYISILQNKGTGWNFQVGCPIITFRKNKK